MPYLTPYLTETLKYCYIATEALLLVMLCKRGFQLWAFSSYLLVSVIAGLAWHPALSVAWWQNWMLVFEPLRLLLLSLCVAEVGYYATTRMFPSEKKALATSLTAFSLLTMVITWCPTRSRLGVMIGSRQAVEVGLACFMLAGCLYFWAKPIEGTRRWIYRHALLLTEYLTCIVLFGFMHGHADWYVLNGAYMVCGIAFMLAWIAVVTSAPRPAALRETRSF